MHILGQAELLELLKVGGTAANGGFLIILIWVLIRMNNQNREDTDKRHKENREDLGALRAQFANEMMESREAISACAEAVSACTGKPVKSRH